MKITHNNKEYTLDVEKAVKDGGTFIVQENLDNGIFCGLEKYMKKIDNPFV